MIKTIAPSDKYKKVQEKAFLLNFLKYADEPVACSGDDSSKWHSYRNDFIENKLENEERYLLKCLNQYDYLRISVINDDVKNISEVLNQHISPNCLADRRFLCYAFEEEGNSTLPMLLDTDAFVSVILVKIPSSLDIGFHKEEVFAVDLLQNIVSNELSDIKFFPLRTFANKELFFLVQTKNLSDIEQLMFFLSSATIHPKIELGAFSVVTKWLCCNEPKVADDGLFNGTISLSGVCNRLYKDKFSCLYNFPPQKVDDLRQVACSDDGAVRATCNIGTDSTVTSVKVSEIVSNIFSMHCCQAPFCSISVDILTTRNEDFTAKTYYLLPSKEHYRRLPKRPVSYFEELFTNDFDNYLKSEGMEIHGMELKKLAKFITRKLRNKFQKDEYEDLIAIFERVMVVVRRDLDDRNGQSKGREKFISQNIETINSALPLLGYLCGERERPTICSNWYDDGYYRNDISGYSKIANCAHVLINNLINSSTNGCIDRGYGLCTFGYFPTFKKHIDFPVLNTSFAAVLAPKHHFGLFHEIGHIAEEELDIDLYQLFSLNNLLNGPKGDNSRIEITKDLLVETFADIHSHLFGIRSIDIYFKKTINLFIDNILYDNEKFPLFYDNSAQLNGIIDTSYIAACCKQILPRLFAVIVAGNLAFNGEKNCLKKDSSKDTYLFVKKCVGEVLNYTELVHNVRKNKVSKVLMTIIQDVFREWESEPPCIGHDDEFSIEELRFYRKDYFVIFTVARKITDVIFDLGEKNDAFLKHWDKDTALVSSIIDGKNVYTEQIKYSHHLLNALLEKDDDVFSSNVAMILSLASDYNRDNMTDISNKDSV